MAMPAARCCRRQVISSMPWCCYFCSPAPGGHSSLSWDRVASPLRLAEFSGPRARNITTGDRLPRVRRRLPSVLQAAGSASSSAAAPTRLAGPPGGMGSRSRYNYGRLG